MTALPSRQLLKVGAVAELLGVSAMTVYRLIEREELRAYRVSPNVLRVDARDVADYVRSRNTFTFEANGGAK